MTVPRRGTVEVPNSIAIPTIPSRAKSMGMLQNIAENLMERYPGMVEALTPTTQAHLAGDDRDKLYTAILELQFLRLHAAQIAVRGLKDDKWLPRIKDSQLAAFSYEVRVGMDPEELKELVGLLRQINQWLADRRRAQLSQVPSPRHQPEQVALMLVSDDGRPKRRRRRSPEQPVSVEVRPTRRRRQ